MTSRSIIQTNLHSPNNKLVSAWFEHFWCTNEPWAYTDSQDSPWPRFGGSHQLPPYSILCDQPLGLHPNVILSRDTQVESFKISKFGTFGTLEGHNFLCRSSIEVRSQAKLWPLLRTFQLYVECHLHARISGRFLTFSGRKSNWHFDSWPFFWP